MTNGRDWWAGTHKNQVGPCQTREEAARRYFDAHPLRTYAVLTGYGAFGAHFDIRWVTFKDAEQNRIVDSKESEFIQKHEQDHVLAAYLRECDNDQG